MGRGKFKRGGGGGRGRGRGRGGRGGGGGGGGHRNFQDNRQSFDQVNKTNEKFERFYNTIDLVSDETEREAFWAALRRELPNSFRFTGSKGHALSVRDNLVNRFFPLIQDIKHEGRTVELPKQIPWFPDGLAYCMTTPKNVVRKYESFKEFQRFLVSETGVGNISRQEEVSMIPPLLLDILPHHTVLDLCAAPGSKSAQLVELIHAGEEEKVEQAIKRATSTAGVNGAEVHNDDIHDSGRATGILVANDVNYQRAQMLVHQVKRLNSPNLIVMNHDATMFPSIELPPVTESGQQRRGKWLKFDRILADVPCSGDGTCRKNPSIWKEWSPQNGLGLYITQVRILTRALQMLKVGGRVVYSTCSLNPVENEAVVASAIERCGGVSKVKLVNCSDRLPGLQRHPGRTDWSIMSRNGQIYESWPEAEQYEGTDSKVVPGMFPPGSEESIPLENCIRVYPHQQDTGGFFIAALEKLGEIKAKPETESKSGNRKWTFHQPDSNQTTAFGELVDEITNGSIDKPPTVVPDMPSADASAAERSNVMDEAANGTAKRAASDEDLAPTSTKKTKTGDGSIEVDMERREHWPPPPSVALAVEASDAQPGSQVIENDKLPVSEQVKDASDSLPSDDTISITVAQSNIDLSTKPNTDPSIEPRRRRGNEPANEEAFKYLSPTHPELVSIYDFYELNTSFPRDRFLVRNPAGDPVKGIYYSSQLVKEILTTNDKRGMKFVHAGVKMFMKQDSQGQNICRWRIQTEGLPIIEGWVGEGRVVRLHKKSTLRKLLVEMFPKIPGRKTEDAEGPDGDDLGEIGNQVRNIGMGCCVLRVETSPPETEDRFQEPLTLPLWRSVHSLNLMLPKEERRAMLLRIYNEDVQLINHSDPRQNGRPVEQKGSQSAEGDAQELESKFQNTADAAETNVPTEDVTNGASDAEAGAMVMEQDAVAVRDRIESGRLEVLEDENRKITESMPERDGEGDNYNTTV